MGKMDIINLIGGMGTAKGDVAGVASKRGEDVVNWLSKLMRSFEGERTSKTKSVGRKQKKLGQQLGLLKLFTPAMPWLHAGLGGIEAYKSKEWVEDLSGIFGDKWANTALETSASKFKEATEEMAEGYDPFLSGLQNFLTSKMAGEKDVGIEKLKDLSWKEKIAHTLNPENIFKQIGVEEDSESKSNFLKSIYGAGDTATNIASHLPLLEPLISQSTIGNVPIRPSRQKTDAEIRAMFGYRPQTYNRLT